MPQHLAGAGRGVSGSHVRRKRDGAATELFLQLGYDRTPLARVAQSAGVSRAALFKQFPTKAELFEAAVLAAGDVSDDDVADPPTGDLRAGLVTLGLAYTRLLAHPRMTDLMHTLIAESPKFPELRERTFDFGRLRVLAALQRYLRAETAAGTADVSNPDVAAPQFLGMIASAVFWPRLVHGNWSLSEQETRRVVEEAAETMVAAMGCGQTSSPRPDHVPVPFANNQRKNATFLPRTAAWPAGAPGPDWYPSHIPATLLVHHTGPDCIGTGSKFPRI